MFTLSALPKDVAQGFQLGVKICIWHSSGELSLFHPADEILVRSGKPDQTVYRQGGAVHMRSVGNAPGLLRRVATSRLRRSFVARSAFLTCSVVLIRVDRNASGANFMNHWLNWSTEAAISAFQRCGLSALIRLAFMRPLLSPLLCSRLLQPPCWGV